MRARMGRTEEPTVDVEFCLVFPHEALSVPVMRRVLGDTLRMLGADEDGVADLLLAVTEACTNVLRHAGSGRRYEVVARIGRRGCLIQVVNGARGLAQLAHRRGRAQEQTIATLPESGRGLAIMRACVDDVTLSSGPGRWTVVSLQKRMA